MIFYLKKLHFSSWLSEYEKKIIQHLEEKIQQACLKCNLDVGGYILRKDNFFGKKIICSSSSSLDLRPKVYENFGEIVPAQLSSRSRSWSGAGGVDDPLY